MAQYLNTSKGKPGKQTAGVHKQILAGPEQKQAGKKDITAEEMHAMIANEAYLLAEKRGFSGNHELEDWLHAEAAVSARFEEKH